MGAQINILIEIILSATAFALHLNLLSLVLMLNDGDEIVLDISS